MTTMDQIHRIRELFYEQGKNLNEIAIIMNCDWRTVRKYVDMEDFSSPPPAPLRNEEHSSKLDPFKPQIDSWMEADKLAPRKTAPYCQKDLQAPGKRKPRFFLQLQTGCPLRQTTERRTQS